MDKKLTPDDQGKVLLAQQEQEQKTLQRQTEEEEYEDGERIKRLKQRQNAAFLMYSKMKAEEEQTIRDRLEQNEKLREGFFASHLQATELFTRMMLKSIEEHDDATLNFLCAGESKEELKERGELLQKAKIDKTEFCALVMATLSSNTENKEDVERVFKGEAPSEKLASRRKQSLKNTDEAVVNFSAGNVKKMEQILKEGLIAACNEFARTDDSLTAIHWSRQINGILSILTSHPVLFKDGAEKKLLEDATGIAAMGRQMENGIAALNELCSARMNAKELSEEKEMNLQARVMLMQNINDQRMNKEYQKLFSKHYNPKKGPDTEKLNQLLEQLGQSRALHTLSIMNRDDRTFAVTDPDSRRTLCETLFELHTEKKVEKAPQKKEQKKNEPVKKARV